MKMYSKKMILVLMSLALLSSPAFGETKIATLSLQKIFDGYWKTKQADAALKDRQAEMKKSESEMADSWKKTNEDYQKLLATASDQAVSSEERDRRKKEAGDKLKDLKDIEANVQQFRRQADAILQEEKSRKTKNLLDEIKLGITGRAKAGGYSLVFDADSVLYTNGENDITDSVLAVLNAGAPGEAPKSEAMKPEAKKDQSKDQKK
jgi:outer membrane protein